MPMLMRLSTMGFNRRSGSHNSSCLLQAAYIARANRELPPELMTPAPCSSKFPGLDITLTPDPTPVTVQVSPATPGN